MNTIKVPGTGDPEQRLADLEQAVNYGEVILPFPVIDEAEGSGGGTGGAPSGPAGGDLTGLYPNPTIAAGAVGNAEISDVAYSKVTGAPTSLPPSGTAGGDLSGTYPNPQIAAGVIVDADVSATAAIQYSKLTGTPTSLPPSGTAGGDLTGTYPNPTIGPGKVTPGKLDRFYLETTDVYTGGDLTGQIVNGTIAAGKVTAPKLSPAPVAGDVGKMVTVAAGPALAYTAVPTTLPPSGAASGDLTGTYPAPTIAKLNGAAVGTTTPLARGDILVADGTPALKRLPLGAASTVLQSNGTDAVWGTSLGGPPSGAAGGSLAGTYPNPTIAASAIRGTPSSGGTAREIAQASIWGGNDLIDLSVPDAKISALAYAKLTGAPTSLPPSGAAGGDLTGTYPNPTLVKAPFVDTTFTTGGASINTFFTLASFSLGTLVAGRCYRIRASGSVARATGGFLIVVFLGGAAIGSISDNTAATLLTYFVDATFVWRAPSTVAMGGVITLAQTKPTGHPGVPGTPNVLWNSPTGITGAQTVSVQGQFTVSNASNNMDKLFASVELL